MTFVKKESTINCIECALELYLKTLLDDNILMNKGHLSVLKERTFMTIFLN